MYKLRVKTHFDAAHYIKDYEGKCSKEHGHRWEVEVALEGGRLDGRNMLIDFAEVKAALKDLLDNCLDHCQLNESLSEKNVTAEFLAKWLWGRFREESPKWYKLDYGMVKLTRVTIWESPDCCVEYCGEVA